MIPDEQEAIDAALQMGAPGDLLLVFADSLVRSWKQITKFKSSKGPQESEARGNGASAPVHREPSVQPELEPAPEYSLEGVIRDERGIHVAPESSD